MPAQPSAQHPVEQTTKTDRREWTSAAQKLYLQAKQPEYCIARENKSTDVWFSVELEKYFSAFPTEPVTEKEAFLNTQGWSLEDKRKSEEKVSGSRLNGNYGDLPLAC